MSEEQKSVEPLVLRPAALPADPAALTPALTRAFTEVRDALEAERPVVIVVPAADLLGQGLPADAALATGLLGMMRTLAIEGRKPGWRVNMVAAGGAGEDEEAVEETVAMLASSTLSGQLLQPGGANLGKVVP